jgi:hypothetical protein
LFHAGNVPLFNGIFEKMFQTRHNMAKNQLIEQYLKHSIIPLFHYSIIQLFNYSISIIKKRQCYLIHRLMGACVHSVAKNDDQSKIKT